jgi:hypothetical protein
VDHRNKHIKNQVVLGGNKLCLLTSVYFVRTFNETGAMTIKNPTGSSFVH